MPYKKTKKKVKSKVERSIKNKKRCGGGDYQCDVCGKRAICKCEGCYNFCKSVGERDESGRLVYYGPRYCSKKCQVAHWNLENEPAMIGSGIKRAHKWSCLKPSKDLQIRLDNAYIAAVVYKGEEEKEYLLRNGSKPIVQAAYYNDIELIKRLLKNGVDVNTVHPEENITALSTAVRFGRVDMVKLLLGEKNVNVNVNTYDNNTLLNAVIIGDKNGNPNTLLKDKEIQKEIMKLLLEHDIDVNAVNPKKSSLAKSTPLHLIAKCHFDDVELLNILLKKWRELKYDLKDSEGLTPYEVARMYNNTAFMKRYDFLMGLQVRDTRKK
tara:strand:- start:254 stop:1225 length:972 start_codon:yes stop_codon:yes gene_type:complete